jgi:hypothetical protein
MRSSRHPAKGTAFPCVGVQPPIAKQPRPQKKFALQHKLPKSTVMMRRQSPNDLHLVANWGVRIVGPPAEIIWERLSAAELV